MNREQEGEWIVDGDGGWDLRIAQAWIWLGRRPAYCDRGHYYALILQGIPSLDLADGFPRYFMDLQRAQDELKAWLCWRLECDSRLKRLPPPKDEIKARLTFMAEGIRLQDGFNWVEYEALCWDALAHIRRIELAQTISG